MTDWQKPRGKGVWMYLFLISLWKAGSQITKNKISKSPLPQKLHTSTHSPLLYRQTVILGWPIWANFNISIFPLTIKFSFHDVSIPQNHLKFVNIVSHLGVVGVYLLHNLFSLPWYVCTVKLFNVLFQVQLRPYDTTLLHLTQIS